VSTSNKIQIIERQYTDAIRREMNIQMSGDVSDDQIQRVGHQLGAQYVVMDIISNLIKHLRLLFVQSELFNNNIGNTEAN